MTFYLPLPQLIFYVIIGVVLCLIYLTLLKLTIHLLPKVRYKGLLLAFSAIIRLSLIIFSLLYFCQEKASRFLVILYITMGFVITRFIVLSFIESGAEDDTKS